jgi:hypothetical protein
MKKNVSHNSCNDSGESVNKIGAIVFIVIVWVLAIFLLRLFGVSGGRYFLSIVVGVPSVITYWLVKTFFCR